MKNITLFFLLVVLVQACRKECHPLINNLEERLTTVPGKINNIPAVTICGQVWMQQNLNVTTYRNGDIIPQVTDPSQWATLTTGAWCYYNNDAANGNVYGKLYNWYAVNDARGLAPAGWHVASDAEWTALTNCLGTIAGGKLKERGFKHWTYPNTDATNSSRFTALPGGNLVSIDGLFQNIGLLANFWTSTPDPLSFNAAKYRRLVYNLGTVQNFGAALYADGFSVRCVKD